MRFLTCCGYILFLLNKNSKGILLWFLQPIVIENVLLQNFRVNFQALLFMLFLDIRSFFRWLIKIDPVWKILLFLLILLFLDSILFIGFIRKERKVLKDISFFVIQYFILFRFCGLYIEIVFFLNWLWFIIVFVEKIGKIIKTSFGCWMLALVRFILKIEETEGFLWWFDFFGILFWIEEVITKDISKVVVFGFAWVLNWRWRAWSSFDFILQTALIINKRAFLHIDSFSVRRACFILFRTDLITIKFVGNRNWHRSIILKRVELTSGLTIIKGGKIVRFR